MMTLARGLICKVRAVKLRAGLHAAVTLGTDEGAGGASARAYVRDAKTTLGPMGIERSHLANHLCTN